MKVMMSLGGNTMTIINSVIKKQVDNVDCMYFPNVKEFIHQSNLRHLSYDRLVFSNKFISTDVDMKKLCDYVRQNLSNVEIVMIVGKGAVSYEYIFKKYFDSPLYTLMVVEKPTARNMLDTVNLDIVDIRARYYLLENKKSDLSNKGTSEEGNSEIGNKTSNDEIKKSSKEEPQTLKNTETFGSSIMSRFSIKKSNQSTINVSKSGTDYDYTSYKSEEDSENSDDGYSFDGNNSKNSEFFESSSDDFDLTVGDYGSQHSDSGFVGDDELDELEQLSAMRNASSTVREVVAPIESELTEEDTDEEFTTEEHEEDKPRRIKEEGIAGVSEIPKTIRMATPPRTKKPVSFDSRDKSVSGKRQKDLVLEGKLNIVVGCSGSGATAFVVMNATKMAKARKRVLVIDLDPSNGVLGFIDIQEYYSLKKYNGLSKMRLYSEDGVDILSNGYDYPVKGDINKILGSSIFEKYDYVFIDCPFESLRFIGDSVFEKSNVVVCTISDISKLLETSRMISDRCNVSLRKEIYIGSSCQIANKNLSADSIKYVKDVCLFANGCWLDRV